jgi:prepilin-type N-terminal cleavage/methylation domain-containing protein
MNRRAFTLAELLVGLVLFGMVSVGLYRLLVGTQRIYQSQSQQMDLQENIRAGAAVLPAELRELDARDGDIIAMGPDSIRVRARRQFSVLCDPPALGGALSGLRIALRDALTFGRGFNPATDSLWIFADGDESLRADDQWIAAGIAAAPTVTRCPGDSSAAHGLVVNLTPGPWSNTAGAVSSGAPVRGFETVTYRLYRASDGAYYLGLRDAGGLQPLLGPLTTSGVSFTYFDSTGATTSVSTAVSLIRVRLWAQTAQPVHRSGGRTTLVDDSVVTWIALRNNRRF